MNSNGVSILIQLIKYCMLFAGLNLIAAVSYADDAYVKYNLDSGLVTPLQSTSIQMVEELVVYKDGIFHTDFIFKNTSDTPQRVTIGFPVIGDASNLKKRSDDEFNEAISDVEKKQLIETYYDFRSKVDGQDVPRKLVASSQIEGAANYDFFFVTEIDFKPHQKRTVSNTYKYEPLGEYSSIGTGSRKINYILKTGSTWKGPIERAIIKIFLRAKGESRYYFDHQFHGNFREARIVGHPRSYKLEREGEQLVLVWDLKNIEPDFDISVVSEWGSFENADIDYVSLSKYFLLTAIDSAFGKSLSSSETRQVENLIDSLNISFLTEIYIPAIIEYVEKEDLESIEPKEIEDRVQMIRFAINTLSAISGHTFKTPEWASFYQNFEWYPLRKGPTVPDKKQSLLLEKLKLLREKYNNVKRS